MNWIQPFTVLLIGADRDDLAYLRDVEEGSVFASAAHHPRAERSGRL